MILRRSLWIVFLGLGVVAEAVLPVALAAQIPVRPDTVNRGRDTIKVPLPAKLDSTLKGDSIKGIVPLPIKQDTIKPDTIRAPLAHAEMPPILEIANPRIYDRASLFATGALTISDLLSRVPGLTEYSTGFLAAPTVVATMGDLRRIRLFLDGLELDPMDRRSRGIAPVNDLPIHALEEVRIEVGAEEVRVYARSWRVDRTIPFTRADIATGDQNTNLYRAFFGRRDHHGEVLQVSAEQYSTQANRALPSSDALNLMMRLGVARGPWTFDTFLERTHRNRAPWTGTGDPTETRDTVPSLEAVRSTAYVRFANGDPDVGRWLQLLASANSYKGSARSSSNLTFGLPSSSDSASASSDSIAYESQYLLTGGITRGAFRLSGAERFRIGEHRTSHVMSGRASAESGLLSVSLFAEGRSYMDPSRLEASVRFTPLSRVALVASSSSTGEGTFDRMFVEPRTGAVFGDTTAQSPLGPISSDTKDLSEVTRYRLAARTNTRAEAGLRLRDVWVSGGILRRGATTLLAPAEFDTGYTRRTAVRSEAEAVGQTVSARGRLWRGVNVDAWAVKWSDTLSLYRPQYQTRSELFIQTSLLDRFPRGNFGLLTSLTHEYRSSSRFPSGTDSVRVVPGYRAITFKLEIRVQTAVVSYQFRNLLQEQYAQIPGFNLPRQSQFYGVRWEFWN